MSENDARVYIFLWFRILGTDIQELKREKYIRLCQAILGTEIDYPDDLIESVDYVLSELEEQEQLIIREKFELDIRVGGITEETAGITEKTAESEANALQKLKTLWSRRIIKIGLKQLEQLRQQRLQGNWQFDGDIRNLPIEELDFTHYRIWNCLKQAQVNRVGELIDEDIVYLGLGRKYLEEILEKFNELSKWKIADETQENLDKWRETAYIILCRTIYGEEISFPSDLKESVDNVLEKFTDRERMIIVKDFGLDGHACWSLDKISEELGLARERVWQIKRKVIRKMQEPFYSRILKNGIAQMEEQRRLRLQRKWKTETDIMEMSILELNFSNIRFVNPLKRAGIRKIGQLRDMTFDDLLYLRGFGKSAYNELIEKMWEFGICLKETTMEEMVSKIE